jgi:hypothetical protein
VLKKSLRLAGGIEQKHVNLDRLIARQHFYDSGAEFPEEPESELRVITTRWENLIFSPAVLRMMAQNLAVSAGFCFEHTTTHSAVTLIAQSA